MTERRTLTALGLMSGTSMDGMDAAIVRTDGERVGDLGPAATSVYDTAFHLRLQGELLRAYLDNEPKAETVRDLTLRHAEAVRRLLDDHGLATSDVDVIGFHGHTVLHRPGNQLTRQIGDGALLARATGIPVVSDFRSRDVAAGGQGAPFAPLFHAALATDLEKPLAVLNIGGIANVTWIGEDGSLIAFDTGPGNALIDDWTRRTTRRPMDEGGRLAARGQVDALVLATLLRHPYFRLPPPKSLDRSDFHRDAVKGLSPADGAATLTGLTAGAVARAVEFLPTPPRRWLVCGGGRHNASLMAALDQALEAPVDSVESVGWRGDVLEAQAFAFLAVRSLYGLPLSLPSTTGVPEPTTGGVLHRP